MGITRFTGPVATFTHDPDGTSSGYSDQGLCVMSQTTTIAQNSTTAVSATLYLPANSQIVDIISDVTTAYDSVTSATLTVGTAAAGTQYAGAVDAKTAGRAVPSFTGAQLSAMANIGSNTAVVATVTPVGATTAGAVRVTITYVQNP